MRLDDYRQFLDSQDMTWRVEYRPPIVYCKSCKWRNEYTSTCGLALYMVGPNDFCSKGEVSHDDA